MKEKLTEEDFIHAAGILQCDVPAIKAVAIVESGSQGGFCPDDFPVILFEGHIFYRYVEGVYSDSHPTICYLRWTKRFYGKTWQEERARLELAIGLNRRAALMAASWGRFQVMGFNFGICGCTTIQQFVNKMRQSEADQLGLFCEYIIRNGLADELRERRWDDFAFRYNGPGYKKNDYSGKLARAYSKSGGMS